MINLDIITRRIEEEEVVHTTNHMEDKYETMVLAIESNDYHALKTLGLESIHVESYEKLELDAIMPGTQKVVIATINIMKSIQLAVTKWAATISTTIAGDTSPELLAAMDRASLNTIIPQEDVEKVAEAGLTFYSKLYMSAFNMPFNFEIPLFSLDRTQMTSATPSMERFINLKLFKTDSTFINTKGINVTGSAFRDIKKAKFAFSVPKGKGNFCILTIEENGKSATNTVNVFNKKVTGNKTLADLNINIKQVKEQLMKSSADRRKSIKEAVENIKVVNTSVHAKISVSKTVNIEKAEEVRELKLIKNRMTFAVAATYGVVAVYNDALVIAKAVLKVV